MNRNEKKTWLKHCLQILEPDALQKYKNKISDLLKEYSSDLEKVLLLNNLLDYVFQKYQYLVHEEINLR